MCSYCHEFIKRNRPVCDYCGKVFPKEQIKGDVVIKEHKFKKTIFIIFLLAAAAISGITIGRYVSENFFLPKVLETMEISEPVSIELVELEPSPHAWQH